MGHSAEQGRKTRKTLKCYEDSIKTKIKFIQTMAYPLGVWVLHNTDNRDQNYKLQQRLKKQAIQMNIEQIKPNLLFKAQMTRRYFGLDMSWEDLVCKEKGFVLNVKWGHLKKRGW